MSCILKPIVEGRDMIRQRVGVPPCEDDNVCRHGGCGYGHREDGNHQVGMVGEDVGVIGGWPYYVARLLFPRRYGNGRENGGHGKECCGPGGDGDGHHHCGGGSRGGRRAVGMGTLAIVSSHII